jgi:hypothetical protein
MGRVCNPNLTNIVDLPPGIDVSLPTWIDLYMCKHTSFKYDNFNYFRSSRKQNAGSCYKRAVQSSLQSQVQEKRKKKMQLQKWDNF